MTLADLPVLNPSTPGKEAQRAVIVAALFAAFGVLYALARAAASAPPDPSLSTGVFGFAYPAGWGITPALWSGAATWPTRLARADLGTTLAVSANIIMVIALIVVMYPDILARQGPQYVSPARRILTVVVAFVLAFLMYLGVNKIDAIFQADTISADPSGARRDLFGLAALAAIVFGSVWSFIGPKDFGRRIPLRISHGALSGISLWAAVSLATVLSSQARAFLSSSLDTYYSLLTVDAFAGSPGSTVAWAVGSDVLTAAAAMALCGALLVTTSPQTLGPANRRGAAVVAIVLTAFLLVVAGTTWSQTKTRAAVVQADVVGALGLEVTGPVRIPVVLAGQGLPRPQRIVARSQSHPQSLAEDCSNAAVQDERTLPAATVANVQRMTAWLDSHTDEVSGLAIRVVNCRAALQALLWEPDAAREGIFLSSRPERTGALTYLYAMSGVAAPRPALQRRILAALADTTKYRHGAEAATRFANLARTAGDTVAEAAWRSQEAQQTDLTLRPRAAYADGTVRGRLVTPQSGWRVALLVADEPGAGADPLQQAPRSDGAVLASMVAATDVGPDGSFAFTGLRDGYYQLAALSPAGIGVSVLAGLQVRGDPGVFQLAARKDLNLAPIRLTF